MAKMTIDRALRTARTAAIKGDVAKARQLYLAVLKQVPTHEEARKGLQALGGSTAALQSGGARVEMQALREINELLRQHEYTEVKARCEALLQRAPRIAALWLMLGSAEKFMDSPVTAEKAFRNAIALKPDFAMAHYLLATVLESRDRRADAIAACRKAVELDPNLATAHAYLANILRLSDELEEASTHFDRALELNPGNDFTQSQRLTCLAHMCEWRAFEEFDAIGETFGLGKIDVVPFDTLAFEDHPMRQAGRARIYAQNKYGTPEPPLKPYAKQPGERIRLGYFSADFRNHPMLYLMSGLLREHDKSRFEIYAFNYGAPDDGALLNEAKRHIDHFFDVHLMSNDELVALAREHRIDIAIDRKGYTAKSRTELFAKRLAPIQVNYLAYPGTMGTDFIDYIIADPWVAPEGQEAAFSEEIIRLPHCYQPNDERRPIEDDGSARSDHGLPEDAFVFCCFNQNYKVEPRLFDIWMRVMAQVENSVLWLLDWNRWGTENLRKHAAARGVDPSRIVFAQRLPHAQHLGRLKHADLFVDTFNYNAHTTASDALWAGVPVATKAGRQFSARVGASLVSAVGLPELITETEEEYEALILNLATDPARLSAIRKKLAANRTTEPLFDTKRYARDFEDALARVFEERQQAAGV